MGHRRPARADRDRRAQLARLGLARPRARGHPGRGAALAPPPSRAGDGDCRWSPASASAARSRRACFRSPDCSRIGSLAAARPPRVSLPGSSRCWPWPRSNFFTTTVEDTTFTMAAGGRRLGARRGRAQPARRRSTRQTRRAVGDEQARIARELHDVIAHSVSVIVVQAAGGRRRLRRAPRPGARRAALDRVGGPRRARASCAGCSAPCAPASPADRRRRSRASTGSTSSPSRCAAAGLAVAVRREGAARAACRPASTCPPTGSCRRR